MTAEDEAWSLVVEDVEGRHDLPAGDSENKLDVLLFQAADEQLCGGLLGLVLSDGHGIILLGWAYPCVR
jgi:hypothetical protein